MFTETGEEMKYVNEPGTPKRSIFKWTRQGNPSIDVIFELSPEELE